MEELCYYLILCMQITEEEVREIPIRFIENNPSSRFQHDSWSKNVARYVEDESDDSFSHSVRLSALELLMVKRKLIRFERKKKKTFSFEF